jgi:molybdenum cofactor guanylyltransferase
MNKNVGEHPVLSAAVLAGGMSTRMGTDKALLPLRSGDPPMAAIVLDRLQRISRDVFIVASNRPEYDQFGARVVADLYPGAAALGGIATALTNSRDDYCLVVACDMPFLSFALIKWMAAQPRDYDVLIPVLPGESRQGGKMIYQTLHAIYHKRCLPAIEEQLSSGNRQVIGFFDRVTVRQIPEDQVWALDPSLRSFFNANSPEAVAQARLWLAEAEAAPS